ncbi:TetR family transcriptional regulator [Nocardioides sp. LHG3406-4]|uniref:TetR family transcriptional regulator n=1 Tax=Nocardioides sp. LHG3406-4 TaxID=2804575 RepID=UPI003CEAC8AC
MTTDIGRVDSSRPKDRRALIISRATELFWERGYDGVTVAEVAAAVGVTAGAVYKHVPDKQYLLSAPIRDMVMAWYASALVATDGAADAADAIDRLIAAVVSVAIDRPAVVALWHRESRHLPKEARDELVALRGRTVEVWADSLTRLRPDLARTTAEFRIRAALGILNSVAIIPSGVSRERVMAHFRSLLTAVLFAPLDDPRIRHGAAAPLEHDTTGPTTVAQARREELLECGATLFRSRGYHRVGIDEIGEAAGMRGPSVYGYFDSKTDLLFELLLRMADRLDVALDTDTMTPSTPIEVIESLADRYVQLALQNRDLIAVYAAELQHLPGPQLRALQKRRQMRTRTWTTLLREARPDVPARMAQITALATLEMVFAIARSHRYENMPRLAETTEGLMLAALLDS